jgi:hypothetical protein
MVCLRGFNQPGTVPLKASHARERHPRSALFGSDVDTECRSFPVVTKWTDTVDDFSLIAQPSFAHGK